MPELSILMYHMICEPSSSQERRFACPTERFRSHLQSVRHHGYQPVSLAQVQDHVTGQAKLPEKAVAITLDDGYADNLANAWPVLSEECFPATVFVAVNRIGGFNDWMQAEGYPRRSMLSWGEIRELHSAGIEIGSHTLSHPRLSRLQTNAAQREIAESKSTLEDRLGAGIARFAYPYGDLDERVVDLVREAGYSSACSTRPGFNRTGTDAFLLRRIEVEGTDAPWRVRQKIRYGTNDAGALQPLKYYWQQASNRLGIG